MAVYAYTILWLKTRRARSGIPQGDIGVWQIAKRAVLAVVVKGIKLHLARVFVAKRTRSIAYTLSLKRKVPSAVSPFARLKVTLNLLAWQSSRCSVRITRGLIFSPWLRAPGRAHVDKAVRHERKGDWGASPVVKQLNQKLCFRCDLMDFEVAPTLPHSLRLMVRCA
jgi:hypothetical protein